MTHDEAVRWLSRIKADLQSTNWHGSPDESKALDIAMACLSKSEENERQSGLSLKMEAQNHSEQAPDMVTQFDEQAVEVLLEWPQCSDKVANLIQDMLAHIRLLNSEHELQQSSILDLLKDVQRKNALLIEAANEIGSYVEHEYPKETRDNYPVMQRRYKRDMEIVNRIREEAEE